MTLTPQCEDSEARKEERWETGHFRFGEGSRDRKDALSRWTLTWRVDAQWPGPWEWCGWAAVEMETSTWSSFTCFVSVSTLPRLRLGRSECSKTAFWNFNGPMNDSKLSLGDWTDEECSPQQKAFHWIWAERQSGELTGNLAYLSSARWSTYIISLFPQNNYFV